VPAYTYRKTESGEEVTLCMSVADLEKRQFVDPTDNKTYIKLDDGAIARRVFFPAGGQSSAVWPKPSQAAGVAPNQVQEAMKADRELGVPTEYNSRGDAIFTSPGHQRKYLKAHGLVDRDAYC